MTSRKLLALAALVMAVGCGDDDGDGMTMTDMSVSCPTGEMLCGTACVDTTADDDNCGACGTACGAGEACVASSCVLECPAGLSECSGACVDLDADRANCGGCDNACGGGTVCSAGSCQTSCEDSLTDCEGSCRDLETDRANCGVCGNACGAGEICEAGACAATCGTGLLECDGACVDAQNDRANCGACGTACATGEACLAGICEVVCPTGQTECSGACVDLNSSEAHCSACDAACASGETCTGGTCGLVCPSGQTECGGACVDTNSNPENCGTCGTTCPAGQACLAGSCQGGCGTLRNCDGACVDTQNDPTNCGICGNDCSAGLPASVTGACVAGTCQAFCDPGTANCDADLSSNGCEVDIVGDPTNCGACGITCTLDNATAGCTSGSCSVAMCDTGFGDCDTDPANGCEVDVFDDANNCGVCANICTGGELCIGGTCGTPVGEDCATAVALTPGANAVDWAAATDDYMVDPGCTTTSTTGPDVVLSYTPTQDAEITITLDKPDSQRYAMVVSGDACGTVTTELACDSEFTGAMEVTFFATMGTTYYVYVMDTTSGSDPLPDPLMVTVTEFVPPCFPGTGGLLDGTVTRIPTTGLPSTEYYVEVDGDAGGYVYVGGSSDLYRIPKAGGAFEDVALAAGLTTSNLGYDMLVAGQEIYTLDSTTSTTANRFFRISTNGGLTWSVENYATFAPAPGDGMAEVYLSGSTIWLVTDEGTSTNPTELWTVATGQTAPAAAALAAQFTGYTDCTGFAADASYFYLTCTDPSDAIVRVDRTTSATDVINDTIDMSSTTNNIFVADPNMDGNADALYVQTWYEEAYFVCTPQAAGLQYSGTLATWGGSSSLYGMGRDPATGFLWSVDQGTDELILIQ